MERFIMFADVCRSTTLYEELGDQSATALVTQALEMAGDVVRKANGTVVDTMGDEVLCTFDTAEAALGGARQLHRAVAAYAAEHGQEVALRIGINHGEVIETADNIYGDAVNVGSRLASEAKAQQTVLSQAVLERAPDELRERIRELDEIWIRGKQGTHRIYELLEANPETAITEVAQRQAVSARAFLLSLAHGNRKVRLNPMCRRFTIGRSEENDLMINHPTVSRHHGEIQYQNGRFVYIDKSTNGTHIQLDGRPRRLQRNTIELTGSGSISPGQTASIPSLVITFTVQA